MMNLSKHYHIHQYQDNLHLISLPVPIKGFDRFIGAWIYSGDPLTIVDVGPTVSVPSFLMAMAELGFGQPELILLTHIHIDHAGGIGRVADAFPQAKIACHPKGIRHLIDPHQLWQGSVKTLGDIAKAYEPIAPLAGGRTIALSELDRLQIQSIETPGHAAHHVSYLIGDMLFAGEAGGVCLNLPDNTFYLRPATPPRFFLETSLKSIDCLIAQKPKTICYGHVGKRDDAVDMLNAHRTQLLHWLDLVQSNDLNSDKNLPPIQACAKRLLKEDPLLKGYSLLSADVQHRERGFIHNSIKGYWGYIDTECRQDSIKQEVTP